MAYRDGEEAQRTGLRENYTALLPVFGVGYPKMNHLGKSNFEQCVTKCEKAIQLHSIKAKPVMKVGSTASPERKAFMARKEYNPFLKNVWLLMGKAQFQQGDILAASSTFSYITRLYSTDPVVMGEARLWQVRCDAQMGRFYDADDVLHRIEREPLPKSLSHERDLTMADYLLRQQLLSEARPFLVSAARGEGNNFRQARLYYLLGQVEARLGHQAEAYRAFGHCLSCHPPYEMAFHARIMQTEVLSTPATAQRMLKRLRKMAKDPNNKDYLDMVYFAIGNLQLACRDTVAAIESYEKGRSQSVQTGPEKAALLRRLGDLYWQLQRFDKAQPCYTEAIGLLDKTTPGYDQLSQRSAVLDHLVPYTKVVFEQDSLLHLVSLPEADRNAVIDKKIALLKKQEEEERRARKDSTSRALAEAAGDRVPALPTVTTPATPNSDKSWYFYNARAVQQGKESFIQQWGRRKNEDDWQRANRSILAEAASTDYDYAADDSISALIRSRRDSLLGKGMSEQDVQQALKEYAAALSNGAQTTEKSDSAKSGSGSKEDAAGDPHTRAYYLAQLPFSKAAQDKAHEALREALLEAGIVEKDELEDFPLAERTLRRLIRDYPHYERLREAYYHLFLLARRRGRTDEAERYRAQLAASFPDDALTRQISDPDFERNARYGRELEDSLYAATYSAYLSGHTDQVEHNFSKSSRQYPQGLNRPKFLLIHSLARLATAPRDSIIAELSEVAKDYPKSDVAEMAGMIVRGLQDGRHLGSSTYRPGSLWERRLSETVVENATQGEEGKLTTDKDVPFVFLVAYPTDSLSDRRVLFELARFNFGRFVSRGLDIAKDQSQGVTQFRVSGFRNYTDVYRYAQLLFRETVLRDMLKSARVVLISASNLKLLGTVYSFEDYRKFYDKHFVPLRLNSDLPLEGMPGQEDLPKQIYEDELPDSHRGVTDPAGTTKKRATGEDEYEYDE